MKQKILELAKQRVAEIALILELGRHECDQLVNDVLEYFGYDGGQRLSLEEPGPTEEEIEVACARIQEGWTDEERDRRRYQMSD